MKKPKCKLCGSPHWTYEGHAINIAINRLDSDKERSTDAINQENIPAVVARPIHPSDEEGARRGGNERGGLATARTPNRRSREAYNSYMKDYMARYRNKS